MLSIALCIHQQIWCNLVLLVVCYHFQDYRLHLFHTDCAVIAHVLICQEVLANGDGGGGGSSSSHNMSNARILY